MYTTEFDYQRANSVSEALAMLAQNPDAKLLAGGHSLVPAMKLRLASPSALIDVSRIADLRGIRVEGGTVVIGAMTTHRDVEFSETLADVVPILPEVARLIGDPMVRNKGTVGGALAHADPAADYPAVMLALGASMKIASSEGERVVPADEFFLGMFQTAVEPGEMLVEIHVPARSSGEGQAYAKFPHPASRYAIAGVAAVVKASSGAVTQARVAMTGAGEQAVRLTKVEAALQGQPLSAASIAAAVASAVSPDDLIGDSFASAEYRAHLVSVQARDALTRAFERANT
ncbi:FAD binding domain-containing protein [Deinococcus yavapaiensis]|uniref:Carbon-monoxide dehydrogenase medium subunit n=1 Tax=Deinococcus yavapaiensis KR-236 TaxID=694435 RepID=A0A318SIF6_9DEIO|nr:xanthine dehydrogenase family protein subunit M [Deinococcus yavapaiensis]PYE51162.1 carbon-monoxide dehydrogenase medium subunit [Deinococcus yavapaiensis KR-236]